MQNILVVIQARMLSTRLPGKVMMPLLGKSLLARMIERLQMMSIPATLLIATTQSAADDVIEQEANQLGIACYRGSTNNLLDRHYQAAKLYGADVVLKIPSDCPLIDPQIVDQVLSYYLKNAEHFDYVSNLHPATWPDGNDVEVMSFFCVEKAWESAEKAFELEHTTPYIWENTDLFRVGNVISSYNADYSMSHRFTIDYPEDYQFIKEVFESLYPDNPRFTCSDILRLLERRPEIYQLNAGYAGVNWYRNHLNQLKTISQGQTKYAPGEIATIAQC